MQKTAKKLTKVFIDGLDAETGKPQFYWDSELKGFGIKINGARKTYVVQARINGKTVRKAIGTHGVFTAEEARAEAKIQLGQMQKGDDPNKKARNAKKKSTTLKQAYDDYKETRQLTAGTLRGYELAMNGTFKDWKDKRIVDINRDMVERVFKDRSKVAPALTNLDFRFLRALLNFAMEKYSIDGEPLIPSNPCNRLKALKMWNRVERRTNYIPPTALPAFFAGMKYQKKDNDYFKTAKNQCLFILFSGCREQEAARLKVQDVDFKNKIVTFSITKNHKKHTLPLGTWLLGFLKELSKDRAPDDFLFPANTKSGHIENHRKAIKEISTAAGVSFTLHDLRRTFASIVNHHLGQSFSPYTIKRLLNHSETDITAGYIQFGIEDLRKPMQMIEDFILEAAGVKQKKDNVIQLKRAKRA